MIGQTLAHYRITARIGAGGTGGGVSRHRYEVGAPRCSQEVSHSPCASHRPVGTDRPHTRGLAGCRKMRPHPARGALSPGTRGWGPASTEHSKLGKQRQLMVRESPEPADVLHPMGVPRQAALSAVGACLAGSRKVMINETVLSWLITRLRRDEERARYRPRFE